MSSEINLLSIQRGSITAPAGCGKTQLIVSALEGHSHPLPVLILTHTNAGVAALRQRLKIHQIDESKFKLATIDGWCLQISSQFPKRSGIDPERLKLLTPNIDYPAIRGATNKILKEHHLDDIFKSNFTHLIVDEYQDCSTIQHEAIVQFSNVLPTCVLGDPLQAIFGFKGNTLVDWVKDVQSYFVPSGELTIPWRWKNAGCESLGLWLLEARKLLVSGQAIDFSKKPPEIKIVSLVPGVEHNQILQAASQQTPNKEDSVLIIGDSMNVKSRHQIAGSVHGATTVEPVDFKDLINFAQTYDQRYAFTQIHSLMKELMTGIAPLNLDNRVQTIQANKQRNPPTPFELKIIEFIKSPTNHSAIELIKEFSSQENVRVYRPAIYNACLKGFQIAADNPEIPLKDAMIRIREQNRAVGRKIPKRAVGSTLLLKGLEAEHVVILNADDLDARNLYVAMTRGSKSITLCSKRLKQT